MAEDEDKVGMTEWEWDLFTLETKSNASIRRVFELRN